MSALPAPDEGWSRLIRPPARGLPALPLRELWEYRDLILLLARRDVSVTYSQTVLGPFWYVIQPALATIAFSFIFGRMGRFETEHMPHMLFYMAGLMAWNYFAECLNRTAHIFTRNAAIFRKVYFPRLAVPIATVLTSLLGFGIQLLLFLAILAFYLWKGAHVNPNWRIVVMPVLLVQMGMLGMGVGCIVSSLTTRFRDLSVAIGFAVQIWMFGSMVVFPLSRIAAEDRWIFALNPMVPTIEAFRFIFLGVGRVEMWQLALSFCTSALVLLIGIILFQRAEHVAVDAS